MNRIYFDQNILSEMRSRKLLKSKNTHISYLLDLCKRKNTKVIYSFTHFDEIHQIEKDQYINEHLQVLDDLNAIYISANDGKDENISVFDAWSRYLETNTENKLSGGNEAQLIMTAILKKSSGLPIFETFDELHIELKNALFDLLSKGIKKAKAINTHELTPDEYKNLQSNIIQMERDLENLPNLEKMEIPIGQELGPVPFRKTDMIRRLKIESLPENEVIEKLEKQFTTLNPNFNWSSFFPQTFSGQLSKCYSLLNFAGYHADDFNKQKKHKDRFRASHNDMMHLINAESSTHLISNDTRFINKARACYHFLGSAIVASSSNCVKKLLITIQPTLTRKATHLFVHSLSLIVAQKHTTLCGQVASGVICR